MDIKSKEERSHNMAKIRSKNTRPEAFIRSLLHKQNYRFRANYKEIEGHPDLYFTRKKLAVFVHGCYWHRHKGCKYSYSPKSNIGFWNTKFEANIKRDRSVTDTLLSQGVRILIIWECTVKKMQRSEQVLDNILGIINGFIKSDTLMYMEV